MIREANSTNKTTNIIWSYAMLQSGKSQPLEISEDSHRLHPEFAGEWPDQIMVIVCSV